MPLGRATSCRTIAVSASSGCPRRRLPAPTTSKARSRRSALKLLRGASEREVMTRLDALLDRYGGRAAYGRKDQTSHAWLDHELDMLSNMSRTLPPIFLLVSAFLVNLTLSRLVALEREQIGLLKALGYRNARDRPALPQVRHHHRGCRHRHRQRRRDVARRVRHAAVRRLFPLSVPRFRQEPGSLCRRPASEPRWPPPSAPCARYAKS